MSTPPLSMLTIIEPTVVYGGVARVAMPGALVLGEIEAILALMHRVEGPSFLATTLQIISLFYLCLAVQPNLYNYI